MKISTRLPFSDTNSDLPWTAEGTQSQVKQSFSFRILCSFNLGDSYHQPAQRLGILNCLWPGGHSDLNARDPTDQKAAANFPCAEPFLLCIYLPQHQVTAPQLLFLQCLPQLESQWEGTTFLFNRKGQSSMYPVHQGQSFLVNVLVLMQQPF